VEEESQRSDDPVRCETKKAHRKHHSHKKDTQKINKAGPKAKQQQVDGEQHHRHSRKHKRKTNIEKKTGHKKSLSIEDKSIQVDFDYDHRLIDSWRDLRAARDDDISSCDSVTMLEDDINDVPHSPGAISVCGSRSRCSFDFDNYSSILFPIQEQLITAVLVEDYEITPPIVEAEPMRTSYWKSILSIGSSIARCIRRRPVLTAAENFTVVR
jgi:hypothetical protein